MTSFIASLRAVNVVGTGKLPMTELRAMCERQGYTGVRTYIASGNVMFDADRDASTVTTELEAALHAYAGKPAALVLGQIEVEAPGALVFRCGQVGLRRLFRCIAGRYAAEDVPHSQVTYGL